MKEIIHNLKNEALALISQTKNLKELEDLRIAFLGRKGKVNNLFSKIVTLSNKEEKSPLGQVLNEVKQIIQEAINNQRQILGGETERPKPEFDLTLPGIKPPQGHLHLISQAIAEITNIFKQIGFVRVRYPEVDWDWYAFESLNMPPAHPARDEWETFFVDLPSDKTKGMVVLTPHTSNGQVREMERVHSQPPIRMLNIAKCYRRQSDMTHTVMFHQFEGLVIDKNINITHLKGVLDYFAKAWFGPEVRSRLRPFHFQFTEPSLEVDFSCPRCHRKGANHQSCRSCKSGWLEIGGAGMVHPNVLKAGKIDPQKYSGFAFGWGVERLVMLRHQIPNIRLLYENDLRFLEQF